jgi:prepilin-type N-terminal cleavage/methylation domain-containing protein
MKKKRSKKGFSLLEVMLAVAILAIASTMIMNGFIATMS